MIEKIFNAENYGMVVCPCCGGHGYIQNPGRRCCPNCGGFGFIKKEVKEDKNISTRNPLKTKHALGEG